MIDIVKNKFENLPIQLKTSIIYIVCSILQKGVAFIAVPIYTRMVPSEQYGIYSVYTSWDMILVIFATLNMWNYLYNNGMLKYKDRKDDFSTALMGLSGVITICLFCIFLIFNKQFTRWSGMTFGIMSLMFLEFLFRPGYEYWCSRQRIEYDVKKYAVSTVLMCMLTPLVSIALIYLYRELRPLFVGNALIVGKVGCATCIYILVCASLLKKSRNLYDIEIWKYALSYNLPLIPHFLASVILQQSDRIMIGRLCGNSDAAIYSVAYSVAVIMQIVNTALMNSIVPWTYEALDQKRYDKLHRVSVISLLFIAGCNIFISICAPEIISIMAPEEYQVAVYVIPPVAISNVFMFMFNLFANIEYFYEETKMVAIASISSAITNVVLNIVFIKIYGFIAAGYTTVICYFLYSLCHYLFMKKVMKKHGLNSYIYNDRMIWFIAIISIVLSISVIFLYPYRFLRIAIVIIMFNVLFIKRKLVFQILNKKK